MRWIGGLQVRGPTGLKTRRRARPSKSGASLLQKLTDLPATDIEGLDSFLADWSVKDALRVLDEIDGRLCVIDAISRLADDPGTDELHTLHPLILRSRWLFGPEFESMEYCSNMTLKSVAKQLWGDGDASFTNVADQKRARVDEALEGVARRQQTR